MESEYSLVVGGSGVDEGATEQNIRHYLESLRPDNPFVILIGPENDLIQAMHLGGGAYQVEYVVGVETEDAKWFQATADYDTTCELFCLYLKGDEQYRERIEWQPFDPFTEARRLTYYDWPAPAFWFGILGVLIGLFAYVVYCVRV